MNISLFFKLTKLLIVSNLFANMHIVFAPNQPPHKRKKLIQDHLNSVKPYFFKSYLLSWSISGQYHRLRSPHKSETSYLPINQKFFNMKKNLIS